MMRARLPAFAFLVPALLVPAVALLAGTGVATASLSALVGAWGHDFVVTPFEPMQVMVGMATDKATGKQFNVIKMPDGHLMAVVPFDQMAKMPEIDPKDLMTMKQGR